MQTIYLDISNRGVIPAIYAKQGDVGRKVEVILTNSGLTYEPEAGSAFSAWFSGASGVGNYTDIGDHSAFSVSGNKVTVELITQMLQNAGEGILCLVLSRANGEQSGLWNIPYICEAVPGAGSEAAQQYYTAFSEAVAGLAYPDVSLSAPGKAADAAAVGAALAGKAPAQEDASFPGCYYRMVNGIKEWINPPVIPGVEYRTTERYQGKAVYVAVADIGTLPNKTLKSVEHNILVTNIIRFSGAKSDGTGLSYDDGTAYVRLSATLYYIKVFTNIDLSDQTGMATIYYVK